MFEHDYQRAVDVRDRTQVVYAYFHADEHSLFMPANDYVFCSPIWIIWFPETAEYTSLEPKQFDTRYILETNLPEKMGHIVRMLPSFTEWVAATHGNYSEPKQ